MTAAPPVSACLLSWMRPQNLSRIVAELERHPFIAEILVLNNNPSVTLVSRRPKVRVIAAEENVGCFGRFVCAKAARHPVVYVQDDDVVNFDVAPLYARFLADTTRITHALSPWHYERRDRTVHGAAQVALLGWGAFFLRDWIRVLDDVPDDLRGSWLFRREADRFFTLLLERRHHAVLARLQHLDAHSTPGIALWKEPDHVTSGALATREALRLIRLRTPVPGPVAWNVVVPCRNHGRFLREAVESAVRNDADYVVTIVDDGSSDETPEVAADLGARFPHVTCLRIEPGRGTGYARNRGIAAVDSAFVVSLDADDRIGPDYLFEAGRVLARGADVANPDAFLFGARSDHWRAPGQTTLAMLLERNSVHSCAAFRREYWARIGGFDEQMPAWEDYEFWIRMAAAGARIHAVPGQHFYYRRHDGTRSSGADRPALLEYIRVKHADLFRPAGTAG